MLNYASKLMSCSSEISLKNPSVRRGEVTKGTPITSDALCSPLPGVGGQSFKKLNLIHCGHLLQRGLLQCFVQTGSYPKPALRTTCIVQKIIVSLIIMNESQQWWKYRSAAFIYWFQTITSLACFLMIISTGTRNHDSNCYYYIVIVIDITKYSALTTNRPYQSLFMYIYSDCDYECWQHSGLA